VNGRTLSIAHSSSRLALRESAARIGIDPSDQVAAAIADGAAHLNGRRPSQANPPGLEGTHGQAQQIGCVLFPKKGVWMLVGALVGHVITASVSMQ
jgi:hypothetical protein